MALFGSKKKAAVGGEVKVESKAPAKNPPVSSANTGVAAVASGAILRPRLTEKSSLLAEKSVFCFEVSPMASKEEISKSFAARYGVKPLRVSILPIRSKKVSTRGKRGRSASGRKAYIYTPAGTTIEFV